MSNSGINSGITLATGAADKIEGALLLEPTIYLKGLEMLPAFDCSLSNEEQVIKPMGLTAELGVLVKGL